MNFFRPAAPKGLAVPLLVVRGGGLDKGHGPAVPLAEVAVPKGQTEQIRESGRGRSVEATSTYTRGGGHRLRRWLDAESDAIKVS